MRHFILQRTFRRHAIVVALIVAGCSPGRVLQQL